MDVDLEMVLQAMYEADLRVVAGSIDGDMPALLRFSQALADRVEHSVLRDVDSAVQELACRP